jgi:hypothetical protein
MNRAMLDAEKFMTALRITSTKFRRLKELAEHRGETKKAEYYNGIMLGLDHAFELTDDFIKVDSQDNKDLELASKHLGAF